MKHNSKQESCKKGVPGFFRFVPNFGDKKNCKGLRQKGMSFTELLVALGISALLAAIGYIAYMYFFQVTTKLNALNQIGTYVLERIIICTEEAVLNTGNENLLPVDSNRDGVIDNNDWQGCDSKEKLGLVDCNECEEPLVTTDGRRICMTIKNDRFSQCVGYRPTGGAINRFKITVNRKICVQARGLTATACTSDADCASGEKCVTVSGNQVCEDSSGRSALWPYVDCESDADCGTGLKCLESQGECQAHGSIVKCL